MRRALNSAAALLLGAAALPLVALGAACVRLASPGPAFFSQPRAGRGGRAFRVWKLRTMHTDADARLRAHLAADPAAGAEWARYRRLARDPRVIGRVGRFLRRTSLDELPQLWNVLRGEMALVGPRPLELDVLARYPAEVRARRAAVRPGLTGLWQVSGRSDLDLDAMIALDLEYARRRTARTDLGILLRTPGAVLRGRGAY